MEANVSFDIASRWLADVLSGPTRVGLPWLSLGAFVRIATNPRGKVPPLSPGEAWSVVEDWLRLTNVSVPGPTRRHSEILGALIHAYQLHGNLITDGQLAAIAVEHGLTIYSADTDFARFSEVRWVNPLA